MSELWAMQVPAFNRGLRLISGTVAQLPLSGVDQIDPAIADWVTMQRTTRDLVLHGKAYWLRLPFDRFRHLRFTEITVDPDGTVFHGGDTYRLSDPTDAPIDGTVICIDGFADGVLLAGSQILSTAMAQVVTAGNMANSPAPTQILKNTSNYELSGTEVDELLTAYSAARASSTVAYLNGGVDLTTFGYSSLEQQAVENMNQSAIQIARLLNLDPFWVGAGVPGSALTYQNRVDMRQDLVDLTLSDYISAIEQRLSMRDAYGVIVRFDTTEFLRANLDTRARIAIDLFGAGLIDRAEGREFINNDPTGGPT
jgi:Phage portal protein